MPTPTFIIAGERRSGTTSLTYYFQSHPEIYLLPKIDIAYFVDPQTKGIRDRLRGKIDTSLWAEKYSKEHYISLFEGAEGKKAIGEKSADYLFWEESHQRIKDAIPDVKIILSLRNPVERAWSQYINELGKEREHLSFGEALKQEKKRTQKSDHARNHLSYMQRGFYDISLKKLFKTFSREQVHIVILEELIANPQKELKKIYDFIEVDSTKGLEVSGKQYNKNWATFQYDWVKAVNLLSQFEYLVTKIQRRILKALIKSSYRRKQISLKIESFYRKTKKDIKISEKDKKYLKDIYKPHIEQLELMLDKDLSVWKTK